MAKTLEERIMARLNLANHGIAMDATTFKDLLIDLYQAHYRAIPSVDELLVRPRLALQYADLVKMTLSARGEAEAFDLPDDVILRTLLNARKNP